MSAAGAPFTATGTAPGSPAAAEPRPSHAWVVFGDSGNNGNNQGRLRERRWNRLWWLRLLKPGFRHCFALLGGNGHWVLIDPGAAVTHVGVWPHADAPDLPQRLADAGFTLLPAPLRRHDTPAGWAPFTCVEAVKRLLGLRAPWVMTPWGLYRHLSRNTII